MAPSKRRKADKVAAPQTTEAAIALLSAYAETDARLAELRASADAEVAQIRAALDLQAAPYEAEIKALFNQLKPWWAVACDDLTDGKRKSIELSGCLLGHRTTPPKVTFAKADEAVIIDWLTEHGFGALVRVKAELDKPAIIKAVRLDANITDPAEATAAASVIWNLHECGVTITQKEEFFIDRLPPREERVEVVEDPQQVAA